MKSIYNNDNPLRVFTAFSGYDSQCMGLDRIKSSHPEFDYELVGWSEIEPNAIKAHNLIYPQYKERNFGDISKINWDNVPDFDLFTYSSPCQDFSLAGQMRGGVEGSGTRSSLLWQCRRAILSKKPKFLLLENVKNLASKSFFPLLFKWCMELADYDYSNFMKVLNSLDYGVPQNRERVFVVSIRNDMMDNHPTGYKFPKPKKIITSIDDLIFDDVDDKYDMRMTNIDEFKQKCINELKMHY